MQSKQNALFPLIIIGVLFFIFGFITWANGSLIAYFKLAFSLSDFNALLVASAFFLSYFIMAIPSSFILKKMGFKNGMALGLLTMAIGAFLFIPAAKMQTYSLFLLGLFVIGAGLTLLQTATNPYVTLLGPIESAAQRISIMGICNKIAGILAIYILGNIALKNADDIKRQLLISDTAKIAEIKTELLSRVITPYTFLSIVLILLAVIIYFLNLPEVQDEEAEADTNFSKTKSSIFEFSHLLLGAFAIFCYVGVEVISYDTFSNFGEHLGFGLDQAKTFATFTGYALVAGYIFNILMIPNVFSQQKVMYLFTVLSIVLVAISMFASGWVAVICFALLGFSNSVMWPAIWPLAIADLGRFTKIGSALLIMGIIGGAILPPLYGKLGELLHNKQLAYGIMIPCYLYILYFTLKGYKIRK